MAHGFDEHLQEMGQSFGANGYRTFIPTNEWQEALGVGLGSMKTGHTYAYIYIYIKIDMITVYGISVYIIFIYIHTCVHYIPSIQLKTYTVHQYSVVS